MRLAKEYVEDRYSEPIRMEELCRHTGVSQRTLQRSFLMYSGGSPSEYIKARRLVAARQALVVGHAPRDSVSRIARDAGFTHLGRFSVDYRRQFGESPRETLRKHPAVIARGAPESS